MDEKALRSYLVKQPRPAKLVIQTNDDQRHEVSCTGSESWASRARSILALEPLQVELYNSDGQLIRAQRLDDESKPANVPESSGITLPNVHTSDPETVRLLTFAKLLAEAHQFNRVAFEKMVELFDLNTQRAIALESRLERSEANYRREVGQRLEDLFDAAEQAQQGALDGSGDPLSTFLAAAQAGMAARQHAQAEQAPRKPNGKAGK